MTDKRGIKKYVERLDIDRERFLNAEADGSTWIGLPLRLARLRLSRMASSISYFMVFAIFPFLILLLSVVLLFGDNLLQVVSKSIDLADFFPEPVLEFFNSIYREAKGAGSISAISVSIASLVWAASKGINAIILSMRQIYNTKPKRSIFFVSRILSLFMTVVAALFMVIVMIVLAFSDALMSRLTDWTGLVIHNRSLIRLISFGTGFTILNLTFFLIYYFSAARKTKLRHALLASSLAALSWVILSAIFSLYVSRSAALTFYGSLTGVVILMLWLYVCTYALLLGAVLHALLRDRYNLKEAWKHESTHQTDRPTNESGV